MQFNQVFFNDVFSFIISKLTSFEKSLLAKV